VSQQKKKVYAALVVIGLVALVGDRLLNSEPSPAAALAGPRPRSAVGGDDQAATDSGDRADGSVMAAAFPRALPESTSGVRVRDAFALTQVATKALQGPQATIGATKDGIVSQRPAEQRMTAARFAENHRLSAVMHGGETNQSGSITDVAVVDGQWLQLGQVLDECTLIEITGRSAVFECPDGLARLGVEISGQPPAR
jgi:hypothetical protein